MYTSLRKIVLVAEMLFIFGRVRSDAETHSSVACFLPDNCNFHNLNCNSMQKIAIVDAYSTGNNMTDCQSQCPASIPENTNRKSFTNLHLAKVDETCTCKRDCNIRAQSGKPFSILEYKCINNNNEIKRCNGENISGHDVSLLFEQSLNSDCICDVTWDTKEDNSGVIDFHLLTMDLTSTPCSKLDIYIGGNVRTYDCNTTLLPYRYLANGTQTGDGSKITITNPPTTSGRIWIQIKGTKQFKVSCNHVISTPGSGHSSTNAGTPTQEIPSAVTEISEHDEDSDANTGAVAGGVTVAVLVIVAVVLVLLWFKYKRNQKPKPNLSIGKTSDEMYSVSTRMPDHNYHEIEAVKPKQPTSNYDYATVTREVKHAGKEGQSSVEEDYAQIGDKRTKVTGHNNTTLLTAKSYNNKSFTENEDDYNHLAANAEMKTIENGVHTGDYDTAVSASKSVQQIRNKGISNDDSQCDYNHIENNLKPKPLQGDYDTTVSASKAVAKMMETNEQTEDDYDHFRQTKVGSQAADSPYDTAEHHAEHSGEYSIDGVIQKNDPYDLAK